MSLLSEIGQTPFVSNCHLSGQKRLKTTINIFTKLNLTLLIVHCGSDMGLFLAYATYPPLSLIFSIFLTSLCQQLSAFSKLPPPFVSDCQFLPMKGLLSMGLPRLVKYINKRLVSMTPSFYNKKLVFGSHIFLGEYFDHLQKLLDSETNTKQIH